jgi:parvulin-like peptidyl-prolyl isomerase
MFSTVLLSGALWAAPVRKPDSAVLASVNGDPITVQDLVDQFTKRHGGHAKFLGGDMEARSFLDLLIAERLFIQEAYDVGLDQDPKVVEAIKTYENDRVAEQLVRLEIDGKIKVMPEDVKAAWKNKLNVFLHVRQIAVDTKQEVDEIRAALLSGADFETFARDCSRADSRLNGGNVVVNWGQFDPEWERVVFALQPGELSPVIPTPGGYEVVIVGDRVDSEPPPFDKVSQQIENVLYLRQQELRKRAFSEELFAKYHVALQPADISPVALRKLLAVNPDTVLATWDGGGNLLVRDVFTDAQLRMWTAFPPVPAQREVDKQLRAVLNEPLVVLEARARKLAEQPDVVRLVARYRENVMEGLLFSEHILREVTVTDEDTRKYYDAHKEEFVEPEQRHVAHILVATEQEATALREKIAVGADFGQLARKSSRDAATAILDGKLGWITPEKVPPAFKSVLTMKPGEVSKPLKSEHGWHLILVSDIKPQRQKALDEVLDAVQKNARLAKERTVKDFWLKKLRAAAKVQLDDAAIKKFVAENQFDPNAAAPQHKLN